MNFWKLTLLSALAFFAITTTVLYTSCTVDPCVELKCSNGGACINGFCSCPTGYEGAQCDQVTNTKFLGTYTGYTSCDLTPAINDTAVIYLEQFPLNMAVVLYSHKTDTLWTSDTLHGTISGNTIVIPDYARPPRFSRHLTVSLTSDNKLNVYDQEVHIVGYGLAIDTNKTICNFYGLRLTKK